MGVEMFRQLDAEFAMILFDGKSLIAARNGDWENGLFFCGANAGEVNRLSTVREQMEQIMNEWRNAQ